MSLLESAGQSHLRRMWRLSWPAIIEQILAIMVSYADTAMVGVLGAAGTAAVSVNAAAIWLLNGFLMSVGVGYSVQVSHAIGAGDDERVRQVVRQGVLAAAVVGLLALAVYQLLAGSLPRWLGAELTCCPRPLFTCGCIPSPPPLWPPALSFPPFCAVWATQNTAVFQYNGPMSLM